MRKLWIPLCLTLILAACNSGPTSSDKDYQLAVAYLNGRGVVRDEAKGMEYLVKASDAGNADAQLTLGYAYMKGTNGLTKDLPKALELFIQSGESGNRDAQYNAGLMYARGDGVAKDYEKALSWFEKAAYQGDTGAFYNLGVMYINGEGTVRDPLTAYAWFQLASEKGYAGAEEGMASARSDMTSEQAKEIDRTIAKIQKKIETSGSVAADQPL